MVRVGQKKCYMAAIQAQHSPRETLENITCHQQMRSSLCLQNLPRKSPVGNAGHGQKSPRCAQ